jgi:hypothetical protein
MQVIWHLVLGSANHLGRWVLGFKLLADFWPAACR